MTDYNAFNNDVTHHPLVSMVDVSKADAQQGSRMYFSFYTIFLKDVKCGDLVYGRHTYDYQKGTPIFLATGQMAGRNSNAETYQPKGYTLIFQADLVHGYAAWTAYSGLYILWLPIQRIPAFIKSGAQIVLDCFSKIDYELEHAIDKRSKRLIVSRIELFLDYCMRFYDRQFVTRNHANSDILERFEQLLNYLLSDR